MAQSTCNNPLKLSYELSYTGIPVEGLLKFSGEETWTGEEPHKYCFEIDGHIIGTYDSTDPFPGSSGIKMDLTHPNFVEIMKPGLHEIKIYISKEKFSLDKKDSCERYGFTPSSQSWTMKNMIIELKYED